MYQYRIFFLLLGISTHSLYSMGTRDPLTHVTGKQAHQELSSRHIMRFITDPGESWRAEIKFLEAVTRVAEKDETSFIYLPLKTKKSDIEGMTCIYRLPLVNAKNDLIEFLAGEAICFDAKGNRVHNIQRTIGSATGTPPWFMYKNYIAFIKVPTHLENRPGASRRLMFFKGMPQERPNVR